MIYIALLRGVNVGGRSTVSMAQLKTCFEQLGFSDVKTYINSGNVIFRTGQEQGDEQALTKRIETTLEHTFDNRIKVLLKTHQQLQAVAAQIPAAWANDKAMKADVLFLWPEIDSPGVLASIPHNPDIEQVRYHPGVVLHSVARTQAAKSHMTRIVGMPLYAQMTIRNVNTVRKLLTLTTELQ